MSVFQKPLTVSPHNIQRQLRQYILITFGENDTITYIQGNTMWHVSQLSFTECHLTCVTEADFIFLIMESVLDSRVVQRHQSGRLCKHRMFSGQLYVYP